MEHEYVSQFYPIWELISDDEETDKTFDFKYRRYLKRSHLKRKTLNVNKNDKFDLTQALNNFKKQQWTSKYKYKLIKAINTHFPNFSSLTSKNLLSHLPTNPYSSNLKTAIQNRTQKRFEEPSAPPLKEVGIFKENRQKTILIKKQTKWSILTPIWSNYWICLRSKAMLILGTINELCLAMASKMTNQEITNIVITQSAMRTYLRRMSEFLSDFCRFGKREFMHKSQQLIEPYKWESPTTKKIQKWMNIEQEKIVNQEYMKKKMVAKKRIIMLDKLAR